MNLFLQELRKIWRPGILAAWDGEALPDPEEGEDRAWAETRRLAEKCRERVRAMRDDREGRSVLPPHVDFSTSTYARYLAVWCAVSAILLLSPTLVRDRLHRMQAVQWVSRRGRRILNVQFAAVLSRYSGNYVAMLLKGIPLMVVLAVLGMLILSDVFHFGNRISRFLVLPGGEILCALLPAILGLGLVVLTCRRQQRREL